MVRWAESLTAVVWVATEMGFKSQPGAGVEDLVLSQLRLGFNPWPRNFHTLRMRPIEKHQPEFPSWHMGNKSH